MKLHTNEDTDGNRITGYGESWIAVNGDRYSSALVIGKQEIIAIEPKTMRIADLLAAAQESIASAKPQVILLGTGAGFSLAPAKWAAQMAASGIGVEAMDTAAACRTFNVLAYEGREVIAVLGLGNLT